jgi:hypothetical protein
MVQEPHYLNRSHDCSYKRCNLKPADYSRLPKTGRYVLSGAEFACLASTFYNWVGRAVLLASIIYISSLTLTGPIYTVQILIIKECDFNSSGAIRRSLDYSNLCAKCSAQLGFGGTDIRIY